jgi:hypothetical protein
MQLLHLHKVKNRDRRWGKKTIPFSPIQGPATYSPSNRGVRKGQGEGRRHSILPLAGTVQLLHY